MSEESDRAVVMFLGVLTVGLYAAALPLLAGWPPMEEVVDRVQAGCDEGRWECQPQEPTPAIWLLYGAGFLVSILVSAAHFSAWRSEP